jgi:glycosyltransferase involved in cell wall biosynthesis
MRIVFFAIYVRGADSIGRELIEWVRILCRNGHTVRVIVERIGPGTPADIRALTAVHTERSLRQSIDWEYVCTADLAICDYPAFYGLADVLRAIEQPALLLIYHGVTPPALWPDPDGRAYLEQSRRRAALVHFADAAITHSEFTRQELHHLTGYPLSRIGVLPCIIAAPPADRVVPLAQTPAPLILSVGRLAANKRPHLLVEALALVRQQHPAARLILAGDARGPSHAPVLAQVRASAAALGLEDAVLCTGLIDDALLEHLYAQAAVLATASMHEGFCIPVIEAMARGVPVVANRAGALPQTVGDAGVLVPDGDVRALADALIDVLQNAESRAQLIARGYTHAQAYTPAALEPAMLQLLRDIPRRAHGTHSLMRLSQSVELARLAAAAEVGNNLPQPSGRIPLISALAVRLRRWLTSDIERRLDTFLQGQVRYNRQIAQTLHEVDELSATTSEQLAHLAHDRPE